MSDSILGGSPHLVGGHLYLDEPYLPYLELGLLPTYYRHREKQQHPVGGRITSPKICLVMGYAGYAAENLTCKAGNVNCILNMRKAKTTMHTCRNM